MLKHDETEQATLAFLCPFEITKNNTNILNIPNIFQRK